MSDIPRMLRRPLKWSHVKPRKPLPQGEIAQANPSPPAKGGRQVGFSNLADLTPKNDTLDGQLTLWLFNIAMEHGTFIDGLPIKDGDFPWLC